MKITRGQLRNIICESAGQILERRMVTDVFKIVTRALSAQPLDHQQLLARVLGYYPNLADEEIDAYIDMLEDEGYIMYNRLTQKYQ